MDRRPQALRVGPVVLRRADRKSAFHVVIRIPNRDAPASLLSSIISLEFTPGRNIRPADRSRLRLRFGRRNGGDDLVRFGADRVVGVGGGVDDGSLAVDDEGGCEREFPGFVAVEAGEIDAEAVAVECAKFALDPERQAVVTCDAQPEVQQDVELDAVLLDPAAGELGELRGERDESRALRLDLRKNRLKSNLLLAAVRSPAAAEEAEHHGAALQERLQPDRGTGHARAGEQRGAVAHARKTIEDPGSPQSLRSCGHHRRGGGRPRGFLLRADLGESPAERPAHTHDARRSKFNSCHRPRLWESSNGRSPVTIGKLRAVVVVRENRQVIRTAGSPIARRSQDRTRPFVEGPARTPLR